MPTYETYWVKDQDPDSPIAWFTQTIRTDISWPSPELSAGIRARNRQPPPQPNTPEHFYRQERFRELPQ